MSKTHLVSIISDVHFPNQHKRGWLAYKQWHHQYKPNVTVAVGDLVDLGMLSRYEQDTDDPVYAVEQIKIAVKELTELTKSCGQLIYVPGNHEERWEKAVFGKNAQALRGAVGLSLREQYYAQGLPKEVRWVSESASNYGLILGKKAVLIRHGHKQAGGWGVRNVSASLLQKFPTISTVVGHHHRGQLQCRTSLDKTIFAVANPHLSGNHGYATSPDWQRGFTFLEFFGGTRLRDCSTATPYTIIMNSEGKFSFNRKIYPE